MDNEALQIIGDGVDNMLLVLVLFTGFWFVVVYWLIRLVRWFRGTRKRVHERKNKDIYNSFLFDKMFAESDNYNIIMELLTLELGEDVVKEMLDKYNDSIQDDRRRTIQHSTTKFIS